MKVKVTQSFPTLCNFMDYTVPEILQARILEWVGSLSPSPGDLPKPGIEPRSAAFQADSLPAEPQGKPSSMHKALLLHQLVPLLIPMACPFTAHDDRTGSLLLYVTFKNVSLTQLLPSYLEIWILGFPFSSSTVHLPLTQTLPLLYRCRVIFLCIPCANSVAF